jgi:hypothetical protein
VAELVFEVRAMAPPAVVELPDGSLEVTAVAADGDDGSLAGSYLMYEWLTGPAAKLGSSATFANPTRLYGAHVVLQPDWGSAGEKLLLVVSLKAGMAPSPVASWSTVVRTVDRPTVELQPSGGGGGGGGRTAVVRCGTAGATVYYRWNEPPDLEGTEGGGNGDDQAVGEWEEEEEDEGVAGGEEGALSTTDAGGDVTVERGAAAAAAAAAARLLFNATLVYRPGMVLELAPRRHGRSGMVKRSLHVVATAARSQPSAVVTFDIEGRTVSPPALWTSCGSGGRFLLPTLGGGGGGGGGGGDGIFNLKDVFEEPETIHYDAQVFLKADTRAHPGAVVHVQREGGGGVAVPSDHVLLEASQPGQHEVVAFAAGPGKLASVERTIRYMVERCEPPTVAVDAPDLDLDLDPAAAAPGTFALACPTPAVRFLYRLHAAPAGRHVRLVAVTPPVVRTVAKQLAVPLPRAEGGATKKDKMGAEYAFQMSNVLVRGTDSTVITLPLMRARFGKYMAAGNKALDYLRRLHSQPFATIDQVFTFLDTDGSGAVDVMELRRRFAETPLHTAATRGMLCAGLTLAFQPAPGPAAAESDTGAATGAETGIETGTDTTVAPARRLVVAAVLDGGAAAAAGDVAVGDAVIGINGLAVEQLAPSPGSTDGVEAGSEEQEQQWLTAIDQAVAVSPGAAVTLTVTRQVEETPQVTEAVGLQLGPGPDGAGATVVAVDAGGVAERAGGIVAGDVLTHVNGVDVRAIADLAVVNGLVHGGDGGGGGGPVVELGVIGSDSGPPDAGDDDAGWTLCTAAQAARIPIPPPGPAVGNQLVWVKAVRPGMLASVPTKALLYDAQAAHFRSRAARAAAEAERQAALLRKQQLADEQAAAERRVNQLAAAEQAQRAALELADSAAAAAAAALLEQQAAELEELRRLKAANRQSLQEGAERMRAMELDAARRTTALQLQLQSAAAAADAAREEAARLVTLELLAAETLAELLGTVVGHEVAAVAREALARKRTDAAGDHVLLSWPVLG